jgi:protocatechuate 3,4-dioxygenase beta subunit
VWIVARDLDASSPPRRIVLDEVTPEEATTLELILEHEAVIAGTVVDQTGAPIEGAQVSAARLDVTARSGLAAPRPELTDAAGRFALRGLEPGDYRVAAARDPRELSRAVETSGAVVSAGATDVRLVLEADGVISGKVALRSGGSPATYAIRIGRDGVPTTFASERFQLDVPPGRHALWVEGPDFTATSVDGLVVEAAETTDAGTIVVDRGRALRGAVVDASGAGVAGAEVTAGTVLAGTGARADLGEGGPGFRSDVKRTTTRSDGSFALTGVASQQLSLVAVSPAGRSAPVAVPAGADDVTGITLPMLREGRLAGVVSQAGEPLRAIVNAQAHDSPLAMMTVISSDGAYHFDHLAPGRYTVSPVAGDPYAGSPFYPRAVEVRAGATTTLDLPVAPGTATMNVRAPGVSAGLVFVTTRPGSATSALPLVIELGRQDGGQWAIAPVSGGGAVFEGLAAGEARACVVAMSGSADRDTSALFEEMVRTGGELAATCATAASDGTITLTASAGR